MKRPKITLIIITIVLFFCGLFIYKGVNGILSIIHFDYTNSESLIENSSNVDSDKINVNQNMNEVSKKENKVSIKRIDENYKIYQLEGLVNDKDRLIFCEILDNNLLIGVKPEDNSKSKMKILGYDFKRKTIETIYEGKDNIEYNYNFKVLNNGNSCLILSSIIIEFDKNDIRSYNIIKIPKTISELDISFSGDKYAYIKNDELFIADKNFANEIKIYSSDSEKNERPGNPKWSLNDEKVAFIIFGRFNSIGYGIVDIITNDKFINSDEEVTFINWINNNEILYGQDENEETYCEIFDYSSNKIEKIKQSGRYYNFIVNKESQHIAYVKDIDRYKSEVYIINDKSNEDYQVTPAIERVFKMRWNTLGNKIIIFSFDKWFNSKIYIVEISKDL